MVTDEKALYVALTFVKGIGPKMFEALQNGFEPLGTVLSAPIDELCGIPRLTPAIAQSIHTVDVDAVVAELMALEEIGITAHTREESTYPPHLKSIPDAPAVLFRMGDFLDGDAQSIAIVGTRKPSQAGLKIARELAIGLSERGFTIVSGLSRGVDTVSHQGALEANGRTFAVLGSGLQAVSSYHDRRLAEQIRHSGAVFSELRPNAPQTTGTLISRGRIVSGLSLGTIVVEAGERSGSMNTAKRVRKQGRTLFAVDNGFSGNQKLIVDGAIPISDATSAAVDEVVEQVLSS